MAVCFVGVPVMIFACPQAAGKCDEFQNETMLRQARIEKARLVVCKGCCGREADRQSARKREEYQVAV